MRNSPSRNQKQRPARAADKPVDPAVSRLEKVLLKIARGLHDGNKQQSTKR
jgi:hypothetical protein